MTGLSHWVELEKPDRNYRYLSLFSPARGLDARIHVRTHPSASLDTHTESETTDLPKESRSEDSVFFSWVFWVAGREETTPWLGTPRGTASHQLTVG